MVFVDKNQTLQSPEGYNLYSVGADGSYLRLEYFAHEKTPEYIIIYLNDQGREVGRSLVYAEPPSPLPEPDRPVDRRYRLRNAWLLILEGFREVFKCLSRS